MLISSNGTKCTTVIMDGTHEDVVRDIMEWIDDITKKEFDKATCHALDSKHPSIIVIESRTTPSRIDLISEIVELRYPGLCVFNPPM